MRTTSVIGSILKKATRGETVDQYLGFSIHDVGGWYLAVPRNWSGEILEASSLPLLRCLIWRWWHELDE